MSTHLKNMLVKFHDFQIGVKIKKLWNNEIEWDRYMQLYGFCGVKEALKCCLVVRNLFCGKTFQICLSGFGFGRTLISIELGNVWKCHAFILDLTELFLTRTKKTLHSPHSATIWNVCAHWFGPGTQVLQSKLRKYIMPQFQNGHTPFISLGSFPHRKRKELCFHFRNPKIAESSPRYNRIGSVFVHHAAFRSTMKYRYIMGFSRIVVARRTIGQIEGIQTYGHFRYHYFWINLPKTPRIYAEILRFQSAIKKKQFQRWGGFTKKKTKHDKEEMYIYWNWSSVTNKSCQNIRMVWDPTKNT